MTPSLDTLMADFVRRRRKMRATGVFCLMCAAGMAWVVGVALVDRFLPLAVSIRLITLLLLLAILGLAIFRICQLLFSQRFDRLVAAKQIEAMTPALRDRLVTVVTQRELPPSQRGSELLTRMLAEDVTNALAIRPPQKLITDRHIAPAVILLGVVATVVCILAIVPGLGLPKLVARQLMPLADIPPVTTTRIEVLTGDQSVPQGQPVAVVADIASGPGDATLLVGTSKDALASVAMPRTFADRFAVTLPAVERDLVYRVRSGDAVSPTYHIRALTRPAVARLRVRMDFPAYLNREPLTLDSDTGRIETVRGTRLTLTIQSTEPLQNAILSIDGRSILTSSTIDPHVREASFTVDASAEWKLAMTSQRGVEGGGFDDMQIVCVDDRPPIVQFVRSDLRLHPSDVAAVPFQAIDDFGIEQLRLDVETAEKRIVSRQIDLGPERRMIRDVATVDLAPFAMAFGDVVTLTLTAIDGAGQSRAGTPCRVLISPRSVDPRVLRRIDAIGEALQYAQSIPRQPTDSATCLRAIMRAIAASDTPTLSDFLEIQSDRAQQITSSQVWGLPTLEPPQRELATRLADALAIVYRGQQARLLQAEIENIRSAQQEKKDLGKIEQEALQLSITRARIEFESRLARLQISPGAKDIDDRLKSIVDREESSYRDQKPFRADDVARQWSDRKEQTTQRDRIAVAAQTQVLRSDSDLPWARDLQTIARAMSRQADEPPKGFVDAVRTVEAAHRRAGKPSSAAQSAELETARKKLREWAGETDAPELIATRPEADAIAELAALESKHEAAMANAESTDAKSPETWQPPATSAADGDRSTAQQISEIAQAQARLAKRTESASSEAAPQLSQQQAQIADALRRVEAEAEEAFFETDDATERERTLEALRTAQRALSDLPQRLASLQRQAESLQQMQVSAERAARDVRSAGDADREAAERASAEAIRQVETARRALADSTNAVASSASQSLQQSAEQLGSLGESMASGDRQLGTALGSLQTSLTAADMPAAEAGQAKVLGAIADLQASLRIAQRRTVERDPVIAARFYADRAAEALRALPPDLPAAKEYQKETGLALRGAWDAAMTRAVKDKLDSLPAFQSVFFDDLAFDTSGDAGAILSMDRTMTPQWGRLRDKRDTATTTGAGAFVPPGYEQQLKLYFEALDKARSDEN